MSCGSIFTPRLVTTDERGMLEPEKSVFFKEDQDESQSHAATLGMRILHSCDHLFCLKKMKLNLEKQPFLPKTDCWRL